MDGRWPGQGLGSCVSAIATDTFLHLSATRPAWTAYLTLPQASTQPALALQADAPPNPTPPRAPSHLHCRSPS